MSARLDSQYERFADVPKGIFDQFVRQLEAMGGCKPELIQSFIGHPNLLTAWVEAGEGIIERDRYFFPNPLVLTVENSWVRVWRVENENDPDLGVRLKQHKPGYSPILTVISYPYENTWELEVKSHRWTSIVPTIQIRHIDGRAFEIRRLKPGR